MSIRHTPNSHSKPAAPPPHHHPLPSAPFCNASRDLEIPSSSNPFALVTVYYCDLAMVARTLLPLMHTREIQGFTCNDTVLSVSDNVCRTHPWAPGPVSPGRGSSVTLVPRAVRRRKQCPRESILFPTSVHRRHCKCQKPITVDLLGNLRRFQFRIQHKLRIPRARIAIRSFPQLFHSR